MAYTAPFISHGQSEPQCRLHEWPVLPPRRYRADLRRRYFCHFSCLGRRQGEFPFRLLDAIKASHARHQLLVDFSSPHNAATASIHFAS